MCHTAVTVTGRKQLLDWVRHQKASPDTKKKNHLLDSYFLCQTKTIKCFCSHLGVCCLFHANANMLTQRTGREQHSFILPSIHPSSPHSFILPSIIYTFNNDFLSFSCVSYTLLLKFQKWVRNMVSTLPELKVFFGWQLKASMKTFFHFPGFLGLVLVPSLAAQVAFVVPWWLGSTSDSECKETPVAGNAFYALAVVTLMGFERTGFEAVCLLMTSAEVLGMATRGLWVVAVASSTSANYMEVKCK